MLEDYDGDRVKPIAQSKDLKILLANVTALEDALAVSHKANGSFYQNLDPGSDTVRFEYSWAPGAMTDWHPPMLVDRVKEVALLVQGLLTTNGTLALAANLTGYLYSVVCAIYEHNGTKDPDKMIDRSWFSLAIVEMTTNVKLSTVRRYESVKEMMDKRDAYLRLNDLAISETGINIPTMFSYAGAIREFAADFELAVLGQNPRLKLRLK